MTTSHKIPIPFKAYQDAEEAANVARQNAQDIKMVNIESARMEKDINYLKGEQSGMAAEIINLRQDMRDGFHAIELRLKDTNWRFIILGLVITLAPKGFDLVVQVLEHLKS